MTFYNNLPQQKSSDNAAFTLKIFDAYTNKPIQVEATIYESVIGFFTSRGFGDAAARNISYAIIKESLAKNFSPFQYLDTLKGYNNVQLSNIVATLINSSRYKTSNVGTADPFVPRSFVSRNILA